MNNKNKIMFFGTIAMMCTLIAVYFAGQQNGYRKCIDFNFPKIMPMPEC